MSDEIYQHIACKGFRAVSPAALGPQLRDRLLIVNGVPKANAMTSWRIGSGTRPAALIAAMAVVQSQSISNPCPIAQAATATALNGPQAFPADRVARFQCRRNLVVDALAGIEGISCRPPKGAFYTFASCAGRPGGDNTRGAGVRQ
jgi:aspartate aminotransferase